MYYPAPTNSPLPAAPEHPVDSVPAPLVLSVLAACYIGGGDSEAQQKAMQEEGPRLLSLSDTSSPVTVQSLAGHAAVLEALFLRLAKEAVDATRSAEKVRLLKASLLAQEGYGRTVALIAKLNKKAGDWDALDEKSWR